MYKSNWAVVRWITRPAEVIDLSRGHASRYLQRGEDPRVVAKGITYEEAVALQKLLPVPKRVRND